VPTKLKPADAAAVNRNKAMSHPLRAEVLLMLGEAPGSPSEIAGRIEERGRRTAQSRSALTSEVSHHIDYLVKLRCAELVEERRKGRLIQSIYRATEPHLVETEDWEELAPQVKDSLRREFAQLHIDDLVLGLGKGMGLDRFFHLTRDHFTIDQEGLDRFIERHDQLMEDLAEEAVAAAQRMARSGEEGVRVSSLLGCFEIPA
jgi:DNA-binding transcriptional ArsR family regulator